MEDISKSAKGGLWQVPMTTWTKYPAWVSTIKRQIKSLQGKGYKESTIWLRSKPNSLPEMKRSVLRSEKAGLPYVEYMLHSSEFMPGGSPSYPTAASIEDMYSELEELFQWLTARNYKGIGLSDYARLLNNRA